MALKDSFPHIVYPGIHDESETAVIRRIQTTPQHLAVIPIWAQSGPTTTTLVSTSSILTDLYGTQTMATRGKYFNTATLFARTMLAQGNSIMVKRLIPSDTKPAARVILGIDIVKDQVPDSTDPKSVDTDITTSRVEGVRARLVLIEDNTNDVGAQKPIAGSIIATDGTQSKIYPLLELPTSFMGAQGNLIGFRLWAPTQYDSPAANLDVAEKFKTRMFRIQFMQRVTEKASPTIVYTLSDASHADFTLTEGVYDETTNVEYYGPETLIAKYQDDGERTGTAPVYSPFSELYLYQDNLKTVQTMIQEAVVALTPSMASELSAPDAVNLFTGTDLSGTEYRGYFLEGPIKGGLRLGKDNIVYAVGGADGTMTNDEYEKQVMAWHTTFGKEEVYTSLAKFPFTHIYDTGLSMDAKISMMTLLSKRDDIFLNFTTWIASDKRGITVDEELSRALVLSARVTAYPESVIHNTKTTRAVIVTQSGYLVSSDYSKRVPVLLNYASKYAKMAGASSGKMSMTAQMDDENNNKVDLIYNLNVQEFDDTMAKQLWSAGVTYVRAADMRTYYFPAYHSVYDSDTSVLTSPITGGIACDCVRVGHMAHQSVSGNAGLSSDQLIQKCNERLVSLFKDRYGDRVVIVPSTYLTEEDQNNGYSWSTDIAVYANNSPNVMNLNVITRRRSSLTSGS